MECKPYGSTADFGIHLGSLSSVLARTFRGTLGDVILRNRAVATFEKDQVIYDAGEEQQTLFFLQKGFVKVVSITEDGHELIYDVREAGDIVGELCASAPQPQDCAVAVERTQLIAELCNEVLEIVHKNRHLLQELPQILCELLSDQSGKRA